jgi:hypothetical protein
MRRKATHAPILLDFIKKPLRLQGKQKLSGDCRSTYRNLPKIRAQKPNATG